MDKRKKHREYYKAYMRDIRLKALRRVANGGPVHCIRCGFSDIRALQIDHVLGDGTKHRKTQNNASFYIDLARGRCTQDVQILCANCNWIKRNENGEVTGRPRLFEDRTILPFEERGQ